MFYKYIFVFIFLIYEGVVSAQKVQPVFLTNKDYIIETIESGSVPEKVLPNKKLKCFGCQVGAFKEIPSNLDNYKGDFLITHIVKGNDGLYHIILVTSDKRTDESGTFCTNNRNKGYQSKAVFEYYYDENEFDLMTAPKGIAEYYRIQILATSKKLSPYELDKMRSIVGLEKAFYVDIIDNGKPIYCYLIPNILMREHADKVLKDYQKKLREYPDLKPKLVRFGTAEVRLSDKDSVDFKKTKPKKSKYGKRKKG